MVSTLQIDYRFNIISIKTLEAFLVEIDKLILKYTLKNETKPIKWPTDFEG